jgi:hypothetical protein
MTDEPQPAQTAGSEWMAIKSGAPEMSGRETHRGTRKKFRRAPPDYGALSYLSGYPLKGTRLGKHQSTPLTNKL